ncbi:MAG: MobQ family relaxase [Cypionkella sp.]
MASYHFSAKMIGRSAGKSAIAAAAYRAGTALTCPESGRVFDYSRKGGVEASFILAPVGGPTWATDRQALWSAVQAKESRKNSQLAREIILAIPHELDAAAGAALVREWVQAYLVVMGMTADVAIHYPDARDEEDPLNRHAHIMLTTREFDAGQVDGWAKNKARSWNEHALIDQWRESWAAAQNAAFVSRGLDVRVDHRSLTDQRAAAEAAGDEIGAILLARDPEPRMGVAAGNMEQKARERGYDVTTELGDAVRASRAQRAALEALVVHVREAESEVMDAEFDVALDDIVQALPSEVMALEPAPAPVAVEVVAPVPVLAADPPAVDGRDRTRIAMERHLRGLGLDQVEISIVDGKHDTVTLMTPAEVLEALPRLKRANQAGYSIFVRGPRDRDHDVILLDDISAFTSTVMKRDGREPAALVETSPGNYQAWLKLGEPMSAELRGMAALDLARRYQGDTAAADGKQSGRLAGFTNPKLKYKDHLGRSPFVLLHSYAGKVVTAAREMIDAARTALALRKATIAVAAEVTAAPEADSDLVAWWRQGHAAAPAGSSLSEVDWHLTHLALGSGRPPEDVLAALEATADRKGAHAADYAATTLRKALADRRPAPDDHGPSFG